MVLNLVAITFYCALMPFKANGARRMHIFNSSMSIICTYFILIVNDARNDPETAYSAGEIIAFIVKASLTVNLLITLFLMVQKIW